MVIVHTYIYTCVHTHISLNKYRAQRLLTSGDDPSSGDSVNKSKKRVGTLGKFVQGSFFDDAEEVSIHNYNHIL